jgi:hypothetical protein
VFAAAGSALLGAPAFERDRHGDDCGHQRLLVQFEGCDWRLQVQFILPRGLKTAKVCEMAGTLLEREAAKAAA